MTKAIIATLGAVVLLIALGALLTAAGFFFSMLGAP